MQRFCSLPSLSAVLLLACSSSPSLPRQLTVNQGQRTRVVLTQTSAGTRFTLQNESSGSREEVYKDPKADHTAKVVPDAQLQTLLDLLANEDFFQRAGGSAAPGARELITVEQGERHWVLSRGMPKGPDDPVFMSFYRCREYVLAAYNNATGFHEEKVTGADLEHERDALNQSNRSSREKLQGAGGKKEPPR